MECSLVMDNDSGYVSNYQESNLDSSTENVFKSRTACDVFLSEDALLEQPNIENMDSFESVVTSSQESVKTEFSGFNESGLSEASLIIPEAEPIVWYSNEDKEISPSKRPTILSNVTNTYDHNPQILKMSSSDKENVNPVGSVTPKKYVNNLTSDISPDLFDEEETDLNETLTNQTQKDTLKEKMCSKDTQLLRNVQGLLSGLHPPASVTIIQMGVQEMLDKIEENKDLFWGRAEGSDVSKSLLISDDKSCLAEEWPEVSKRRYHGLHYNRSKISEEFEHLCLKYAERYVGVETQSSCTVFDSNLPSSQAKKAAKARWGMKSPGRRLSHLARRRITFSSANLQASSSSAILGSRARQILVDARKLSLLKKSPKKSPRKTPSKSPFKIRKNTPSSSAKKKLATRFREMSGEFENIAPSTSTDHGLSFKRALFSNETAFPSSIEKKSTKRALFSSPSKKSPFKSDKKRKRTDSEAGNSSKLHRSMSFDPQPSSSSSLATFNRTFSESNQELSDQHKKKLQWAVYESLRLQNVTPTHPQYKVFASVLARVTRRFLPNLRFEGRTTEKMFRIARHHAYAVVKGKTVDEIVNEYLKNKLKGQKPQGYVGLEEFNKARSEENEKENVLQDKGNIMESIEKRREQAGLKGRHFSINRIDRIRKVISFEDKDA